MYMYAYVQRLKQRGGGALRLLAVPDRRKKLTKKWFTLYILPCYPIAPLPTWLVRRPFSSLCSCRAVVSWSNLVDDLSFSSTSSSRSADSYLTPGAEGERDKEKGEEKRGGAVRGQPSQNAFTKDNFHPRFSRRLHFKACAKESLRPYSTSPPGMGLSFEKCL